MSKSIKIDLITSDPAHGEWVLYLVEDAPWPLTEADWMARIKLIQDRVFMSVDVAVDGHLAGKYPESIGSPVRIQIDSPQGCPDRLNKLVLAIRRVLADDSTYRSAIEGSKFLSALRVVTGHEMGRFGKIEAPEGAHREN